MMSVIIGLSLILICIFSIGSIYAVVVLWRRVHQMEQVISQQNETQKQLDWLVYEYVSEIEEAGASALDSLKLYEQHLTIRMQAGNMQTPLHKNEFTATYDESNPGQRARRVIDLANQGVTPEDIARHLHIGLDEVRLILRVTSNQEKKTSSS